MKLQKVLVGILIGTGFFYGHVMPSSEPLASEWVLDQMKKNPGVALCDMGKERTRMGLFVWHELGAWSARQRPAGVAARIGSDNKNFRLLQMWENAVRLSAFIAPEQTRFIAEVGSIVESVRKKWGPSDLGDESEWIFWVPFLKRHLGVFRTYADEKVYGKIDVYSWLSSYLAARKKVYPVAAMPKKMSGHAAHDLLAGVIWAVEESEIIEHCDVVVLKFVVTRLWNIDQQSRLCGTAGAVFMSKKWIEEERYPDGMRCLPHGKGVYSQDSAFAVTAGVGAEAGAGASEHSPSDAAA